jgi:hypothetical protein
MSGDQAVKTIRSTILAGCLNASTFDASLVNDLVREIVSCATVPPSIKLALSGRHASRSDGSA